MGRVFVRVSRVSGWKGDGKRTKKKSHGVPADDAAVKGRIESGGKREKGKEGEGDARTEGET